MVVCFPSALYSGHLFLTLSPLHAVGRTRLPSLLSAHPSPLKFHLKKVIIIKSCVSGLQQVSCKKQDSFFSPPTINWIYSLFNNCLPLKPDVFHTWNWGSETGEYQMLTTEPRYVCLTDMEVVLFIITWRWEEVSQVRQMCMYGHLSWAVFLLPGSYPPSSYLQGLWYLMELRFLFIESSESRTIVI